MTELQQALRNLRAFGPKAPMPPAVRDVPGALAAALACPCCRGPLTELACPACGVEFGYRNGTPLLVPPGHPFLTARPGGLRDRTGFWAFLERHKPEDRVWTRVCKQAIVRALDEADAANPERLVVNLGSGFERIFRTTFKRYPAVTRIGLPHVGTVDAFGDVTSLPLRDDSVDLFISCSVLEHVYDPERGVSEMARVIRPGGLVYAEIPFMRAFHFFPTDYQRYTFSGIEALFERHGFAMLEKGISSGPFNAAVLLVEDLASAAGWYPLRLAVRWLLQPVKYLDRMFEHSLAATFHACAFYYLGRRIPPE